MLLVLVRETRTDFGFGPLTEVLRRGLGNGLVTTRMASLRWISMLFEKESKEMLGYIDSLFPALLETLSDPSDHVVLMDIEVRSFV